MGNVLARLRADPELYARFRARSIIEKRNRRLRDQGPALFWWDLPFVTEGWHFGDPSKITAVAGKVSAARGMKGLYTLSQGTGANQPAYANGIISFAGTQFLSFAATRNQPRTVVMFLKPTAWGSDDYFFDGITLNEQMFRQKNGGVEPEVEIFAGSLVGANTQLVVNSRAGVALVYNGASSSITVNLNAASPTGNAGAGNATGLVVGTNGFGGGGANGATYELYGLADCASALSAVQIQQLMRAGAAQYSIAL